jgi:hypothetical protein
MGDMLELHSACLAHRWFCIHGRSAKIALGRGCMLHMDNEGHV